MEFAICHGEWEAAVAFNTLLWVGQILEKPMQSKVVEHLNHEHYLASRMSATIGRQDG